MELDRNGLEVLARDDCLRLLRGSQVGRVIVTDRALPAAFPVNFALLDDDVVFLTVAGGKLDAAEHEVVMAFEVDEIEPALRCGWSVLVQGLASVITDGDELRRARALGLRPWAPGGQFEFVRISTELLSGRRITARPTVVVRDPVLAGAGW